MIYDPEQARQFWLLLVQILPVFKRFRARFLGKASPVHLFWGALDLAATRFSGRPAPAYATEVPNCGPQVMLEAYSHEVSSCGYWPGGEGEGLFYSYAYPEPDGFAMWRSDLLARCLIPSSGSSFCPTNWCVNQRTPKSS